MSGLTVREAEVLQLFAEGLRDKQVARRLKISEKTVDCHARRIFRKLSALNRAHAVAKAISRGIIQFVEAA